MKTIGNYTVRSCSHDYHGNLTVVLDKGGAETSVVFDKSLNIPDLPHGHPVKVTYEISPLPEKKVAPVVETPKKEANATQPAKEKKAKVKKPAVKKAAPAAAPQTPVTQ